MGVARVYGWLLGITVWLAGGLGGVLCSARPSLARKFSYAAACAGSAAGIAGLLLRQKDGKTDRLEAWSVVPGLRLEFRTDDTSAFFLLLTFAVAAVVSLYAIGYTAREQGNQAVVSGVGWNLFLVSLASVFAADNAFTFLVAWECMTVFSFLLMLSDAGKPAVRHAAFVYIAMTRAGTVLIVLAFLGFYLFTGRLEFDAWRTFGPSLDAWKKHVLFFLAVVGFGTKAGLMPFHVWLPRAHPVAPSHVSAIMSAVMIKAGIYGMVRTTSDFLGGFPSAAAAAVWTAIGLVTAGVAILYGFSENDMKKFLAYSSCENAGVIAAGLGISSLLSAAGENVPAVAAMAAALLHVWNHAFTKAALFMAAGAVHMSARERNVNRLGGLVRRMPWTAASFLAGSVSLSSLPPTGLFISEWMMFQAIFRLASDGDRPGWTIAAGLAAAALALTGALAAAAAVKQFAVAFLALPRSAQAEHAREVSPLMRIATVVSAACAVSAGLFPGTLLLLSFRASGVRPDAVLFQPPVALTVALCIGVFSLLAAVAVIPWAARKGVRREETWNCGVPLEPSMSFTGGSFSHSVVVMFHALFRSERTVELRGEHPDFPRRIVHRLRTDGVADTLLYRPVVRRIVSAAQRLRAIQSGNLNLYLLYMIASIIFLLFYIR